MVQVEPGGGPERGMPGEWELFLSSEDAHLDAAFALDLGLAGEDEGCLREVGLAGQVLHRGRGQTAGVGEDRKGVAMERLLGEDIEHGVGKGTRMTWLR